VVAAGAGLTTSPFAGGKVGAGGMVGINGGATVPLAGPAALAVVAGACPPRAGARRRRTSTVTVLRPPPMPPREGAAPPSPGLRRLRGSPPPRLRVFFLPVSLTLSCPISFQAVDDRSIQKPAKKHFHHQSTHQIASPALMPAEPFRGGFLDGNSSADGIRPRSDPPSHLPARQHVPHFHGLMPNSIHQWQTDQ